MNNKNAFIFRRVRIRHLGTAGVMAAIAVAGLTSCSSNGGASTAFTTPLVISVLSSTSPDWVSGGNVAVALKTDLPMGSLLNVKLDGADVSSSFKADPAGGQLLGLVNGLVNGKNTLTAQVFNASGVVQGNASLVLTNYPVTGPMFSGPQETPFTCETESFVLADGSKLGPALDASCSVATRVDYVYRTTASTGAQFKPLTSVTDIQNEMISQLNQRKLATGDSVVTIVKGAERTPNLTANSTDLALMVDVYHELAYPKEMLQALHQALRPDGKLVLLEYRGEDPSVPIKPLHKTTVAQLNKELEANGFKLSAKKDFLPIQHFLVYTKK